MPGRSGRGSPDAAEVLFELDLGVVEGRRGARRHRQRALPHALIAAARATSCVTGGRRPDRGAVPQEQV